MIAAAATLLHGVAGAAAPADAGSAASIWRELAPGAERATSDDGDLRLDLLRFDLERFAAEVVVAGRARPAHARIWLPGSGHTAVEILRRAGPGAVVAVVNGGFFDENGRSLGLRLTHGDVVVPLRGKVDWGVFYIASQRAHIVHSRDFQPRADLEAAIQVGPRILIDGAVPKLKPQLARRTAVALDREGRTVTLVIADQPVDAGSLGKRLAALGFHTALLFDGGPSTQIAAAVGAAVRAPAPSKSGVAPASVDAAGQLDIPGGYPVPDLLAIVRR
ncbi:MAG TPA: phosphodiester glycosidase family protein [Polyangia bacterium]|nr:phosphodiester glycosidase family protein [Polyangia bacterium]